MYSGVACNNQLFYFGTLQEPATASTADVHCFDIKTGKVPLSFSNMSSLTATAAQWSIIEPADGRKPPPAFQAYAVLVRHFMCVDASSLCCHAIALLLSVRYVFGGFDAGAKAPADGTPASVRPLLLFRMTDCASCRTML